LYTSYVLGLRSSALFNEIFSLIKKKKKKKKKKKFSKICTPLTTGGLRIRNLLFLNRSLLGKSLCFYALKRKALWRLVVDIKYDRMQEMWCSNEVSGS